MANFHKFVKIVNLRVWRIEGKVKGATFNG